MNKYLAYGALAMMMGSAYFISEPVQAEEVEAEVIESVENMDEETTEPQESEITDKAEESDPMEVAEEDIPLNMEPVQEQVEELDDLVNYSTHIQNVGWQDTVSDGGIAGTTGKSLRLEGIQISLNPDLTDLYDGGIEYRTHIQNIGWESEWACDGEVSGTTGQSLRLEGIQVKLTGEIENYFDLYYRVHAQNFGWLGWASNGQRAGTEGYSYRLEAIELLLKAKGEVAPGSINNTFYSTTNKKVSVDQQTISTKSLIMNVDESKEITVLSEYDYWKSVNDISEVKSKDGIIEIQKNIDKTDKNWHRSEKVTYTITGLKSGTDTLTITYADGSKSKVNIKVYDPDTPVVEYSSHVQNIGWQDTIFSSEDLYSGTMDQSLRMEAIKLKIAQGDIYYRSHIQNIGWEDKWKSNGQISGTSGQSLRLEAIQIKLSDELAEKYDIYYQVYTQNFGWLDWACNGQRAGTEGYSYRLEGIRIALTEKGTEAFGSTETTFKSSTGATVDFTKKSISKSNVYLKPGETINIKIEAEYDYWKPVTSMSISTSNDVIQVKENYSKVDKNWHATEKNVLTIEANKLGDSFITVQFAAGSKKTIQVHVNLYERIENGNTITYLQQGNLESKWSYQNNAYYLDYIATSLIKNQQQERVSVDGLLNSDWYQAAVTRTGVEMPNCFTYAMARISEITNQVQTLDGSTYVAGAGQLWDIHDANFYQSSTPRKGALIIWQSSWYGHVAVVEDVFEDGSIAWSQSNYGGNMFEFVIGDPKNYASLSFSGYLINKNLPDYTQYTSVFTKDNSPRINV